MRPSGKRLIGLCAVALLSGAVTVMHVAPAQAQPKKPAAAKTEDPKETAKKRYGEASKLFKNEDYAGALPLFQQADELYPGAAPKHKIAVCFDKLGKAAEAADAYKKFIESEPGEKYAEEVEAAKTRIAELEKGLPGKVTVKVTPEGVAGVSISVDGSAVEGTELQLDPDKEHTIVVTAEGHQPATEVVTLKGNESRELNVALTPVAATPPPAKPATKPKKPEPKPAEEPEEGGSSNVPAYVTIGIAGAGVILGIVFGVQALGKKNKFEDRVAAGDATADELTEIADDAERAALIADMSFGVALTFGITGAVLLFSGGDEEAEPAESSAVPRLMPYAGTKGGGMAATWTF